MRSAKRAPLKRSSRTSSNSALFEALEPRVLMTASLAGQFSKFAVNIPEAGVYTVNVYQSPQQFVPSTVTSLTLNAVNSLVPVVIRPAGTPAPDTGLILTATWNLTLGPGRTLVRVNNGYFVSTTPIQAPGAPSSLQLTVQSGTSIALQWADNSNNESGFVVQRQTAGSTSWNLVTTTPANVTSFTDATLQAGTQYAYSVMALNDAGYSAD